MKTDLSSFFEHIFLFSSRFLCSTDLYTANKCCLYAKELFPITPNKHPDPLISEYGKPAPVSRGGLTTCL